MFISILYICFSYVPAVFPGLPRVSEFGMDGCLVMRTEAVDAGDLGLGRCFGGEHPVVLTVRVNVVVPIFGASNDDEHVLISGCEDR